MYDNLWLSLKGLSIIALKSGIHATLGKLTKTQKSKFIHKTVDAVL